LSLKNFLAVLILFVGTLFGTTLRAEELNVYFKTTPRVGLIRPFVDPTDLSLLITGADGRPIEQGTVAIRLEAPTPGRFFSTDIPLVEGTVLNEMQLPLRQGRASWKQLLPIRGEYRLTVDVVSGDGTKTSKMFTFDVRENRMKWFALTAFSGALFLLGFVAGRVFTAAPTTVVSAMLVAMLLAAAAGIAGAQQSDATGTAVLEIEPATVGKPSQVSWRLAGAAAAARMATLTVTINHLEKQKIVFAAEKIAVPGAWSMKFHFPDGAQYRVAAVANVPGMAPVRNEQVIAVTGVEPPATATVPVLSFFTALIAVGLGVGRWSKRRGGSQQ
jgi:hypothetical protein